MLADGVINLGALLVFILFVKLRNKGCKSRIVTIIFYINELQFLKVEIDALYS